MAVPRVEAERRAHLAEIDDQGDIDAQAGSKEWALAVRVKLQSLLHDVQADADSLKGWMSVMERHEGYRHLYKLDGNAFATFESFCVEPKPFGLGYERQAIDHIIAERKDARAKAEHPKHMDDPGTAGPGRGHKTGSIRTPLFRGDNADYLTARIARDRPDILERMKAGEFRSVRQAAIAAGIGSLRVSVSRVDPAKAVAILLKHFTRDQLLAELDCPNIGQ